MCGIAGFFSDRRMDMQDALSAMADVIYHRGPDDSGCWHDAGAGIGFAHRRLSILDLSTAGHQPMTSDSGRFVIVFNGEIYNHLEIRKELEISMSKSVWRGHADTETILAGFQTWGIEATIRRSVGMFAMAIWDKAERTLTLVRDRIGEKPLYYGWNRGTFLFASELKALRAYPGFDPQINRDALTLLLRHNYIPAPYSIYRGIFKLWPGTILSLKKDGDIDCPWNVDYPPFEAFTTSTVSFRRYWTLKEVAEFGQVQLFSGNESEAAHELERVLKDAILSQQISDVPLGAFLSGGIDSSTIAALMQVHSSRPIKTFTIGFTEAGYNEAEYAKDVARHLGTDHTELYVTSDDARNVIPLLPSVYDEPFSDSSQIPTFLVSQMAKKVVTVALSGDAGDELFGGYIRYFQARSIASKLTKIPLSGRRLIAKGMRAIPIARWNALLNPIMRYAPSVCGSEIPGDRMHKIADILATDNADAFYRSLISHWKKPADIVIDSSEQPTVLTHPAFACKCRDFEHRMMFLDSVSYLPDDILVKVDRAAMAVSLETRVPFLDHRVVEFAWRLPLVFKMHGNTGKWILRQVLYKYVPPALIERPKTGFGVPLDSWLRGPLREWGEELIHERRLKKEGFFHVEQVRKKWDEHILGVRNWHYYLWNILMFQAWFSEGKKNGT